MQPHGLYNLTVDYSGTFSRNSRVGLRHGRTAVPLFLLYLKGLNSPQAFELHTAQDAEMHLLQHTDPFNRRAWEMVGCFFQAEGSRALVVALPFTGKPSKLMADMLGVDRALGSQTGIYAIKRFVEHADLIVVPQAAELLSNSQHRRFYEELFGLARELKHYFILVDFPKTAERQAIEHWLKNLECSDAAAYFPWVWKNGRAYPPTPIVAAAYQVNDKEHSIHELPANRPLSGGFVPLLEHTPVRLHELMDMRLNVLHRFPTGEVRIWGGNTLADKLDFDGRFISVRRTLVALRESIQQICEPFVLEPITSDLPQFIQASLHSFFESVRRLFDPDAKDAFVAEVDIVRKHGQDIVQVDVGFNLPYAMDQIRLSLGLEG
ncbi:MAG: hypothetical protein HY537_06285 [Deltaproteobacteria bacterium]|nr:hypothetical protein [Deltaproteobacteria bacterium]